MSKNIYSVALSNEASRLLKQKKDSGFNFSEWVSKQIISNLHDEEYLKGQLKKHQKEVKNIKNQLKLYKVFSKKMQKNELSKEEIDFFKQAKTILEKNGSYLGGQISLYNNQFFKSINKTQFLEKLKEVSKINK